MTQNIFERDTGFGSAPTPTISPLDRALNLDLTIYSSDELLTLRKMIDELLPITELKHINLHQESVIQYMQSRKLLNDVMSDSEVPPNQKAQVNNSVQSNLAHLDRMQKETYTYERSKQAEQLIISFINEHGDDEQKKRLLDEFARRLGEL